MHRGVSGTSSPGRRPLCCPGLRSGGYARGPVRGTDQGPVVPAPRRASSDTRGASAEAAEQISAGPSAHHLLLGQGELWGPAGQRWKRRAAAAAPDSFRVPVRRVPAAAGHRILTYTLGFCPRCPGLARPGSWDSRPRPLSPRPPGNTELAPCRLRHLRAPCRGGGSGPG